LVEAAFPKFFAADSNYKYIIDYESHFTLEGNEWQQKSYHLHPAPESVQVIKKSKFVVACHQ
jgi:hypothetical protein